MFKNLQWTIKQKFQKLTRGYSDDELWNLDTTFCEWIIPRLKTFKEKTIAYPPNLNNLEEWHSILEKMIVAFETHNKDIPDTLEDIEKEDAIINEGIELFCKYFNHLWW